MKANLSNLKTNTLLHTKRIMTLQTKLLLFGNAPRWERGIHLTKFLIGHLTFLL